MARDNPPLHPVHPLRWQQAFCWPRPEQQPQLPDAPCCCCPCWVLPQLHWVHEQLAHGMSERLLEDGSGEVGSLNEIEERWVGECSGEQWDYIGLSVQGRWPVSAL
jgi:hypothetical protein